MATAYNVKFMFADATVIEEEFAGGVTVIDAKLKLIGSWPEGEAPTHPPVCVPFARYHAYWIVLMFSCA